MASTTMPARGAEYAASLRARLFNHNNRTMALVHNWQFWYEHHNKTDTKPAIPTDGHSEPNGETETTTTPDNGTTADYADQMEVLAAIDDVRTFWNVFNNFDVLRLPYREAVHLFHLGVKPTWEDERNARGGSLCFKVPRAQAAEFWKEICVMAIGEQLQAGVETDRQVFRDDICGVSCSNRLQTYLVQVWSRDAEHVDGIEKLQTIILDGLSPELRPRQGSPSWPYYKKHSDHKGFKAVV